MKRINQFSIKYVVIVGALLTACSSETKNIGRDFNFQPIPDFGEASDGTIMDLSLRDSQTNESWFLDGILIEDAPMDAAFPTDYSDVPNTHAIYNEVTWSAEKQLIEACQTSPPKFCPDDPIRRSSVVVSTIKLKYGTNFTYTKTPAYFKDVNSSDWRYKYIQKAVDEKIAAGMEAGLFFPDEPATRAAGATILAKAKWGETCIPPNIVQFSDVPSTHWGYCYILKLKEANIASPCNSTNFCPDTSMTRGTWVTYLYKASPF